MSVSGKSSLTVNGKVMYSVSGKLDPSIREYVPASCCKDSLNTPNITKCQGTGKNNANKIPVIGPPVPDRSMNDQLYTQVIPFCLYKLFPQTTKF